MQYLIDKGVKLHSGDPVKADFSPIFYAIKSNNLKAVEMICDYGLQLDLCVNSSGYTPLTFAIALNADEIVNYLSLRGCLLD